MVGHTTGGHNLEHCDNGHDLSAAQVCFSSTQGTESALKSHARAISEFVTLVNVALRNIAIR